MLNINRFLKTLVTAILSAGLISGSNAAEPENNPAVEKCYGIAKKGMNDCSAYNHSCQGESARDNDPGEYLLVPAGTCQKIRGGSLKSSEHKQE